MTSSGANLFGLFSWPTLFPRLNPLRMEIKLTEGFRFQLIINKKAIFALILGLWSPVRPAEPTICLPSQSNLRSSLAFSSLTWVSSSLCCTPTPFLLFITHILSSDASLSYPLSTSTHIHWALSTQISHRPTLSS